MLVSNIVLVPNAKLPLELEINVSDNIPTTHNSRFIPHSGHQLFHSYEQHPTTLNRMI